MMFATIRCNLCQWIQGPEVRSGDLSEPIIMEKGQKYTFTIREGGHLTAFTQLPNTHSLLAETYHVLDWLFTTLAPPHSAA